jgi:mono/diheme cytochrome c family protein
MSAVSRPLALLCVLAAGSIAACGGSPNDDAGTASQASVPAVKPANAITAEARQEAQQIFATRCSACHGPEGRGNGPGAAAMDPKPRNYHDPDWQRTVTDEEIETAIVYGGAAVKRSPLMVGNPDLASKPAVVAALREIVRNFGQTP